MLTRSFVSFRSTSHASLLAHRKISSRILKPRSAGLFLKEEREGVRLVFGLSGNLRLGRSFKLYWLVDEQDGVIADAKFQAFGPPLLFAIADVACEWLVRKNYDQALRITADLLAKELTQERDINVSSSSLFGVLCNDVLEAIDVAAHQCFDIPFAESYVTPPMNLSFPAGEGYPGFAELSKEQKIAVLEQVIETEIRPYIELDAGGIEILDLTQDYKLLIAYQGSCTSCYSATGSTLTAIQQILRGRVCAEIEVVPDLTRMSQALSHPH